MVTATLEKALRSLSTLPVGVQEELCERLLDYVAKWHELRAGIVQASQELERGEDIGIADPEELLAFLQRSVEPDGDA